VKPLALLATISVAIVAGFTGCGSSGSDAASKSASDQVKAVVTRALTQSDPAQCETLATNRWLEQNFGEGEGSTLDECKFDSTLPGQPEAHSVRFDELQVHGNNATTTVAVAGGEADLPHAPDRTSARQRQDPDLRGR
jgi:hypothetical protein